MVCRSSHYRAGQNGMRAAARQQWLFSMKKETDPAPIKRPTGLCNKSQSTHECSKYARR